VNLTREVIFAAATFLAAAGVWLLLPRGGAPGKAAGGVLTATAMGLFISQMSGLADWSASALFWVLAGITIIAALGTISMRNPAYCALWFGLTLLGTAGLFLFQGAQFLAVATMVVYAGAILVTFLFVLMLAQPEGHASYDRTSWEALLSAAAGTVMVGILTMAVSGAIRVPAAQKPQAPPKAEQLAGGVLISEHTARLGEELFGRHLIAVEVAGVLLLVALVGAAAIVGGALPPWARVANGQDVNNEMEAKRRALPAEGGGSTP
jgi:NADH-quinone oxidoreductase subunit J